jgi:hypothetical protein
VEVSVVSLTPHLLPCHIILLTLSARQCASDWCAATRARIDFITTATAMPIQQRHGQAHHERLTTDKAIVRQQRDAPSTGAQKPTGQRQTHGYPSWRPVGGLPNARRKCPKVGVRRRSVAAWTCQRARAVTEVDWTHPFPGDCAGQTRTNACAHACKTAALPLLRHRLGPRTSARSETTANRTNTHRSTHPSHTDRQRHRQGHTYTQTDTHTRIHTHHALTCEQRPTQSRRHPAARPPLLPSIPCPGATGPLPALCRCPSPCLRPPRKDCL